MRIPPSGGGGATAIFAKLFANWTSALFYIVAEVYSSVSVGILFWQYANDVVSVSQAKRFYPLFAQMSGIAPIVAGQYAVRYASRAKDFGQSLRRLTWLVNLSGLMICMFYRWSNAYIEKTEKMSVDVGNKSGRGGLPMKQKKKKSKMTMIESARFLASSEYLRLIATLVVGYGRYYSMHCTADELLDLIDQHNSMTFPIRTFNKFYRDHVEINCEKAIPQSTRLSAFHGEFLISRWVLDVHCDLPRCAGDQNSRLANRSPGNTYGDGMSCDSILLKHSNWVGQSAAVAHRSYFWNVELVAIQNNQVCSIRSDVSKYWEFPLYAHHQHIIC